MGGEVPNKDCFIFDVWLSGGWKRKGCLEIDNAINFLETRVRGVFSSMLVFDTKNLTLLIHPTPQLKSSSQQIYLSLQLNNTNLYEKRDANGES